MNKKRIVAALIPSLIVLGVVAYLWSVNLVFLLASELSIETAIENRTYWATNGDEITLEFTTRVDAPNTCSTSCEFLLREVDTNKTLFENSGSVNSLHTDTIAYVVERSTTDTLHLSYTAKCANLISAICSTASDPYYETTFITIHHQQTQEQKNKESRIQSTLENTALTLATTDHFLNQSNHALMALNISTDETLALRLERDVVYQEVQTPRERYEELLFLFQTNKYEEINQDELATILTQSQSLEAQSFQIQEQSTQLFVDVQSSFEILNTLIPKQEVLIYLEKSPATNSIASFAADSSRQLQSALSRSSLRTIFSIESYATSILQLEEDIQTLETFYEVAQQTLIDQTKNLTLPWNTSPSTIREACEYLEDTTLVMQDFNDNINTTNLTVNQSILIAEESLAWYENNSFNLSYPNSTPYHELWIEDIENLQEEYCVNISTNITLTPLIIPEIKETTFTFTQEEIETFDSQTCVYGVCSPADQEQPYPIILVHGHALTSVTSPEAALHSFSKIQGQLEHEGYVNVGELNDYPIKSWKEVEGPISVRASYYFLSYAELGQYQFYSKKYESIESYAIRLKEIVDEVKVKTGSDKVVILAHSMGGLVTRQYLSLFGEADVEKAILVGTPNNGVIGASKSLCSLTGADRECEEMAQGSVFLRRLNQFVPTQTKVYTIAGIGCPKDGFDGDGVVNLNSVQLDYANNTIVQGVCTDALNAEMHKALINPDEYPQVYDKIVEILEE